MNTLIEENRSVVLLRNINSEVLNSQLLHYHRLQVYIIGSVDIIIILSHDYILTLNSRYPYSRMDILVRIILQYTINLS